MKRLPLIIISCSRSGSSMVSGIFVKHGFWCGTCRKPDRFNLKGYYENLPAKNFMKKFFGDNIHEANRGKTYKNAPGFKKQIETVLLVDGYPENEPAVVKFGACYYPAWRDSFPGIHTICVWRDADAIIESGRHSFKVTQARIDSHQKIMERAEKNDGAIHVDYEEIVRGNYSQLRPAFDKEGVVMDIVIIDEFVDPKLNHYGRDS